MNATLKCDEAGCGWTIPVLFDDIPSWAFKACPSCRRGEIVCNADMDVWRLIKSVHAVDAVIDQENKAPRIAVVIDTAPMRKVVP